MLAPIVAAFVERAQPIARAALVGAVAVLATAPALSRPRRSDCPHTVARLTEIWEPQGRDALEPLRVRATSNPCLWPRVARLERDLCWQGADDDELRAFGHDCSYK